MSETLLFWSLPVAIAIHNLEEALWLPRWSERRAARWHRAVGAWPFRFAVVILTVLAFAVAAMAQVGGRGSLGHYLLASYALGQAVNVFVPHLAAAVVTRACAPGLLTGIALVIPTAWLILSLSFSAGYLHTTRFIVVAAVFIPAVLLSIPVLFRLGRFLEVHARDNAAEP
jgi:hypothetical protein